MSAANAKPCPKLRALLDQYAQEAGFTNMLDLKDNYTPKAYGSVVAQMVLRALADKGFDRSAILEQDLQFLVKSQD
jgi:hypothetical protein